MKSISNKKKIIFDMGLNIVATAIPVFALQLLILPQVDKHMDGEAYGLVVTILSMFNVFSSTLGNSLNNIRLINDSTEKQKPNYNFLLVILCVINFVLITIFSVYYYKKILILSILLNIIVSLLWLTKEYFIVAFRIRINYVNILKSNFVLTLGYICGYGLFLLTDLWQLIYIVGLTFCLVFVSTKSQLWKEPIKIDSDFKIISWQTFLLTVSTVLYRIPTYADKMIIYPLLGGKNVSVFYVATLFGKIVSMAITPVSGVILTYLSKSKNKSNSSFNQVLGVSVLIGVLGYVFCLMISRPLLGMIYPNYIEDAWNYIPITTGTVVITALITVVDPFVLRFFDMKWQVIINGAYVVLYVLATMVLMDCSGLMGFCIGALLTAFVKLIFETFVFIKCKEK